MYYMHEHSYAYMIHNFLLCIAQNPIGVDTIEILTSSKGDVIILWEVRT